MARYAFLAWLLAFGAGVALADNGPRPWGHGGHGPSAEDRARFWDKVIQSLRSSDKTATPDEVVQAHLALDRFVEQQKADPNNPKGVQTVANDIDAFIDRWRAQIFTDGPNGLQVKPEGANDPHLLGGLVGVSQALLKIGQNSKTMGIADAALDEAEELTPGQRAALERQRAAADGAIDAAWQDIPRPVESMLRHSPLTGDLQKEGWTPPDPAPAPSPAPGRPPAAADDADAQAQGAARQAQEGDLSGAESGYTKALSRDPTNLDALTGRAQTRLGLENYPGAAADASAALQLAPDDLGAKETLRYATDHLGSALPTAKPGDPWTSAAAGGAAAGGTDAGGMDAGGAVAGGAGGLTAGSPAGRDAAASASLAADALEFTRVKDYERARPLLDQALALDPRNADALGQRAVGNLFKGRYGDAVQDMLAALQSSPAQAGNARAVARELNRRGRYGEAKDVTLALLRLDPNDPSAHFELARAENGLGHRAVALAELRQAAALDPAYRAKSDAAQAAGESQDLSFLFDEPGAAGAEGPGRTAGADAQRRRSIGFLVLGIAGGFIVALGLLELLLSWRGGRGAQEEAAADAIEAAVPAEAYSRIAGPRFRDAYGIIRQLGVGGMGVVYEAVDQALGRRVAVKKMRDEIRADPRERERFLKEARTVAALRHPGIVAIHSIVEDGEDVYLIFEYVDGETLYHLLDRRGRLGLEEAAVLIEKAAQALGYAHDHGIIHRDLKLSNIMLSAAGEVKVMDFGIARQAKDAASRLSTTGSVAGTPPYMAPEQEHGLVCRESDIYSLAVCFYELLTGNLPFQGSAAGMLMNKMNKSYAAPSRLAPELPGAVDEFFAAAFEPEPTRRFRTVQDFVHALRQAAAIV